MGYLGIMSEQTWCYLGGRWVDFFVDYGGPIFDYFGQSWTYIGRFQSIVSDSAIFSNSLQKSMRHLVGQAISNRGDRQV